MNKTSNYRLTIISPVFNEEGNIIRLAQTLDKYINFLFGFLLPFGVAFMLPVFIYITTRIGLTTPEMLISKRKFVILAIFVFAAILTPPDVVSQVLLGVPMLLLYEVGILVSRMVRPAERA